MVEKILERTKKLVWPEICRYLKDPSYPKPFQIPPRYRPDVAYNWQIAREYPERQGKYLRQI
ncbi:MAG: hypothetical protein AB1297_07870, partial [bacterium]